MTPCAGNGTLNRSSPTSPLRRASTNGSGYAVCSPRVPALTCTTSGGSPSTAAAPPLRRLIGFAPSSPVLAHPHHTPAYLGEVVVHAQDIRQPLGLVRTPSVDALTPVADFFARRDFTVASRTHVAGLQLRADDGPFATGTGPLVTGSTLALVMSMAGRVSYVAELDGPGVPALRSRLQAEAGESVS